MNLSHQDGSHDNTVDTQNTCHNHRHDVLHCFRWMHGTHARDTHTGLGRTICSTQICNNTITRSLQRPGAHGIIARGTQYSLAKTRAADTPMKPKKAAAHREHKIKVDNTHSEIARAIILSILVQICTVVLHKRDNGIPYV